MQTNEGEDETETEEELEGGEVLAHWARDERRGSADVGNEVNVRRRTHVHPIFTMGEEGDDESNGISRSRSRSRTPTHEDLLTISHWSRDRVLTPPRELDASVSRSREKTRTPPRESEDTRIHRPRPMTPVRHLSLDKIKPEHAEIASHLTRSSAVITRSRSPSFDGYDMVARKRAPPGEEDEPPSGSKSARGLHRNSIDLGSVRRSADANPISRTESENARRHKDRPPSRESSLTALLSIPPNSPKSGTKPPLKGCSPPSFFSLFLFTSFLFPSFLFPSFLFPSFLFPSFWFPLFISLFLFPSFCSLFLFPSFTPPLFFYSLIVNLANRYDSMPNLGSVPPLRIKTNFFFLLFFLLFFFSCFFLTSVDNLSASDLDVLKQYTYTSDSDNGSGTDRELFEDDLDTPTGPLSSFDERYEPRNSTKGLPPTPFLYLFSEWLSFDPYLFIAAEAMKYIQNQRGRSSSTNLTLTMADLTNDNYDAVNKSMSYLFFHKKYYAKI
jgi:hypothetical protein